MVVGSGFSAAQLRNPRQHRAHRTCLSFPHLLQCTAREVTLAQSILHHLSRPYPILQGHRPITGRKIASKNPQTLLLLPLSSICIVTLNQRTQSLRLRALASIQFARRVPSPALVLLPRRILLLQTMIFKERAPNVSSLSCVAPKAVVELPTAAPPTMACFPPLPNVYQSRPSPVA